MGIPDVIGLTIAVRELTSSDATRSPEIAVRRMLVLVGCSGFYAPGCGYGHPFRPMGFLLHPIGTALDWALVKPFYMLGALAPEWFGFTTEDAQRYQSHMPELRTPRTEPRRFD